MNAPSLSRRIAWPLAVAFLLAGIALLALGLGIGRRALAAEHEASSIRMAALFEASLRRSMIERNLQGLEALLVHLGNLPGLRGAALLHPSGQVRFASAAGRIGQDEAAAVAGLCLQAGCSLERSQPVLRWQDGAAGEGRSLRVVWPVHNEARCAQCHGLPAQRPVNGVLLLDFAPMASEQQAAVGVARWLLPAALATLGALAVMVAWVLRTRVLRPLAALTSQARRLGAGDLDARSTLASGDEMARLGMAFDSMAGRLQERIAENARQHAFLQAVLDAAPDPMLVIGEDHRIMLANRAYARLVNRPIQDIRGQPCHAVGRGLHEPCATTLVQCPLAQLVQDGQSLRTVMEFHRRGDASDGHGSGEMGCAARVSVEVDAAALIDAQGRRCVVEVIRPLDDQIRFSQEQRLSAVGLLANGVAHEIHNPLASIRLALQALGRQLQTPELDRVEMAEYLALVDGQIDRCVAITRRLMSLSEPSMQRARPVDVGEAVQDVVALMQREAQQQRVQVQQDIAGRLCVLGDPGELRQVLLNLLQNALHAMPQGGVVQIAARAVSGSAGAAHAAVWSSTAPGLPDAPASPVPPVPPVPPMVRITVQDTGVGISAECMALIFLPFYSRRADGRQGTGMGLAICKSLVEQRGGNIRAAAVAGQGTTITVELPDAGADRQELQ